MTISSLNRGGCPDQFQTNKNSGSVSREWKNISFNYFTTYFIEKSQVQKVLKPK